MTKNVAIHWFRQDLRLVDNPSFNAACKDYTVLPIYILDNKYPKEYTPGAASLWYLNYSLEQLTKSLKSKLSLYIGDPIEIITELIKRFNISKVFWNRCYEPWSIARDKEIKQLLISKGIGVSSFNSFLLWEPWQVSKSDNTPYKVFTPFYRKGCLNAVAPREPINKFKNPKLIFDDKKSKSLEQLNLLPIQNWGNKLLTTWKFGEQNAVKRLNKFIAEDLSIYKDGRNYPAKQSVSRLSAALHFGEISPNQIWCTVKKLPFDENVDHFCSELGWREFAYNLLYYNPELPFKNLQSKFDLFPWIEDDKLLSAWQQGRTGIPMVDAGMRELWQTGFMHNRVRMIVASFLVKNLQIHWQHGERWFWDCLVDADLANNSAGWQWVAGCGADAAPYFRIFNPITQGEKFDQDGNYVRKFIPEIQYLPNKYLFCPWNAPDKILQEAKIILGKTYPYPIVDLKLSREQALIAYKHISGKN